MVKPALSVFRRGHIGRALFRSQAAFETQFLSRIRALGFEDFRPSDVQVFRLLSVGESARVSEIAIAAKMTKQGMGKLVLGLEDRGYIHRTPDDQDRRAKCVSLSKRGEDLLQHAQQVIADIETEWEGLVGARRFASIRQDLLRIADHFGPPDTL